MTLERCGLCDARIEPGKWLCKECSASTGVSDQGQARLPYMPFYVRDFLSATRSFSLEERGAYITMLAQTWDTGPLPKQPAKLAATIGCTPKELARVWKTVRAKFLETPAGLINVRLEDHRAKAEAKRQAHIEGATKTNLKLGRNGGGSKVVHLDDHRAEKQGNGTLGDTLSESLSDTNRDA